MNFGRRGNSSMGDFENELIKDAIEFIQNMGSVFYMGIFLFHRYKGDKSLFHLGQIA